MDFFAVSGSFSHAVIRQNATDGGNLCFIAVQIPEKIDEKNKKFEAAIEFYRSQNIPLNVAEIAKERIQTAPGELTRHEFGELTTVETVRRRLPRSED